MRALVAVAFVLAIPAASAGDGRVLDPGAGSTLVVEAFDTLKQTLHDLDGDGDLEIVAHNDNNRVYVLDAEDGSVLAELATRHPPGWRVRELNDVAVGDLDADGRPDLVVANSAAWLTRFEVADAPEGGLAFERVWEVRVDPRLHDEDFLASHPWIDPASSPTMDGGPYLADVDGDGRSEIFVQLDGWPGHFSFDADGALRWMTTWSDGNGNPWVADLDGDGALEAIFATDSGRIHVYDARRGDLAWTFDASAHGATPGSVSVSPAVGDLDGDGRRELVFGARQAVRDAADPGWMAKQHARFFAVSPPGRAGGAPTVLWTASEPWMNPHTYTHPALVDVDGDGDLDVVTMDWNTIGHRPGAWESTGAANLFAVDGRSGAVLWRQELESPWNNKDLAVADWDGDGTQEVVLSDPRNGVSGLTTRDLGSGAFETHTPAPAPWGGTRGPVVADVDDDGSLEALLPLTRPGEGCPQGRDVGCREGAWWMLDAEGRAAAWTGRFTFDAATEDAYSGRVVPPALRALYRWEEPPPAARPALVLDADAPVRDVEAHFTDGARVDLDPDADGAWRAEAAFPAEDGYAVLVEFDLGGTTLVVRAHEAATGAPQDARGGADALPRVDAPTPGASTLLAAVVAAVAAWSRPRRV